MFACDCWTRAKPLDGSGYTCTDRILDLATQAEAKVFLTDHAIASLRVCAHSAPDIQLSQLVGHHRAAFISIQESRSDIAFINTMGELVCELASKSCPELERVLGLLWYGNVKAHHGEYQFAADFFKEAADAIQSPTEGCGKIAKVLLTEAFGNAGYAVQLLGDFSQAVDFHQRALLEAGEHEDAAVIEYSNLGRVWMMKSFQEANTTFRATARDFYRKAQVINRKLGLGQRVASNLNNIGILSEGEEALDAFHEALQMAKLHDNKALQANIHGNLTMRYLVMKDPEAALAANRETLKLFCEIVTAERPFDIEICTTWTYEAEILCDLHRFDEAKVAIDKAYQKLEAMWTSWVQTLSGDRARRSIWDLGLSKSISDIAEKVYLSLNLPQTALVLSDHFKARALIASLRADLGASDCIDCGFEDISAMARSLRRAFVCYTLDPSEAYHGTSRNISINIYVVGSSGKFQGHWRVDMHGDVAVWLQQLSKSFGDGRGNQDVGNESLSEGESRACRGSVVHPSLRLGRKRHEESLAKANRLLEQLHDVLIRPIAGYISCEAGLVIAPVSFLSAVCWPALKDSAGRHLIESHRLSVVSSLSVLKALLTAGARRPAAICPKTCLVVGNPAPLPESSNLETLDAAEKEASMVAEKCGGAGIDVIAGGPICGFAAMKESILPLLNAATDLVHFACHSVLHEDSDLIALVLGGQDAAASMLYASEIVNLRLSSRVVVLSACESANGQISTDGLLSLARCFVAAGCQSVLASLWKVDDSATHHFMELLYEHWAVGMELDCAVQAAMCSMLNEKLPANSRYGECAAWRPEHWSAFVLYGLHGSRLCST